MCFSLDNLVAVFGRDSDVLQTLLPALDTALDGRCRTYRQWEADFSERTPKKLSLKHLTKYYQLDTESAPRIVFLLQTYYALVCKLLAAHKLGSPKNIETIFDGSHFVQHGIENFRDEHADIYDWYIDTVNVSVASECAEKFDYQQAQPLDALKQLYHDLFPKQIRHQLGEYYTPDWLAHHTLTHINITAQTRLLDPMCGSGTFVVLAYRQLCDNGASNALEQVAGIDVNPLACLSAKTNLLLNLSDYVLADAPITLPIYHADTLLNPPDIGTFDAIVGNPPWINWETLSAAYRQQTKHLWEKYDLFPHKGFASLLGKGKKDLSILMTHAVVDQYLAPSGQVAFVLTQSLLKTGGAAEGFRTFNFPNHDLDAVHVDDFSKLRVFSGAETRPIVLVLGTPTDNPPSYFVWDAEKATVAQEAPSTITQTLTHSQFVAEPVGEWGSAWLTGKPAAIDAVRKILGQSDYTAHAGVYTGGANAVYWLTVHERKNNLVRVSNIIKGAKRAVPQVDTWLETDLIYPLLRGRDVNRWQADPTVHILMLQNPETRQGYDAEWLTTHYPLTYAYIQQFEDALRQRATLKRYFDEDVPFWTMFNVGTYTFAPYKVIWHGFGRSRMHAVVVGERDGKA
ncbi:MAG: N-6 DNA methylase, partial [Chloroflexota bacterium]